jgi:hypothetical protein
VEHFEGYSVVHGPDMHVYESSSRAQETSGENPYMGPKGGFKLPIVGDSAVRLLITLGARSAW